MRYTLAPTGKRSFSGINVEHKNENIFFKGVQKVSNGDADKELFKFVNSFFESLTEKQLNTHWELLKKAKLILEPGFFGGENEEIIELRKNNLDYNFINAKLLPILKKCYENIKPADIAYAADITGFTNPPADLNYITSQGDYPEETTINDDKYRKLTRLAFITQPIFPVLNQLLDHISIVTGKDFKDAVVGDLISKLPEIVHQEGYVVLDTYLRASCLRQEQRRTTTTVVSEVKYIDHIVYKGLFTKLCLTFIPSLMERKNISNELNSLVAGEIRGDNDAKFKSFGDPKPTGDDLSIQEGYSIAQEINASDELAQAEYFVYGVYKETSPGVFERNYKDFFKDQCLGLGIKNQAMAEKIYNTLPTSWGFRLCDAHIKLLQLTFQDDIPYGIYPALDYDQLMAALSLCQTKLFEMGFENLACFMFAVKNPVIPPSFIDDTYKLNTKDRDQLIGICSDYVGQQTGSTDNSAVIAATDFLEELASSGWDSNIEVGLLGNQKYLDMMSANHRYPVEITSDIKKELLGLVMYRSQVEG